MNISDTWLLLDSPFLCWRAFHSMPELTHTGVRTEITFSYLKTVLELQDRFQTKKVAHCFDGKGKPVRQEVYPTYKSSRHTGDVDEEKIKAIKALRDQMTSLERDYLPTLGFKNVFSQPNYEADDILASIVTRTKEINDYIIVSSDKDLYQLLSNRVKMFNPRDKKITTEESFTKDWGIEPGRWSRVKAIAGCTTDDVKGVKGVGEKTAIKFLQGKIKAGNSGFDKIMQSQEMWNKNLPIVTIPYAGTNTFRLTEDEVTKENWSILAEKLGMKSLLTMKVLVPGNGKAKERTKQKGFWD